ncbi:hypothetical protein D3C73_1446240 [compost metagenome]
MPAKNPAPIMVGNEVATVRHAKEIRMPPYTSADMTQIGRRSIATPSISVPTAAPSCMANTTTLASLGLKPWPIKMLGNQLIKM